MTEQPVEASEETYEELKARLSRGESLAEKRAREASGEVWRFKAPPERFSNPTGRRRPLHRDDEGEWVRFEDYQKLSERSGLYERMYADAETELRSTFERAEKAEAALEAERQRVLDDLLSEEAVEAAARAAWEPSRIVGWDHATNDAQDDARKRIRLAFEAALQSLTQEDEGDNTCSYCGAEHSDLAACDLSDCTETPSEPEYRVVGEKGQRGSVAQFETGVAASLVWADARKSVWEQKGYRNVRIQARNAPSDEWTETPSEEE